jgi:AraC-like DNA-binding protein
MDALTNILDSLRMRTHIFSRAEMHGPYGVRSNQSATGIFHAVVHGRLYLKVDGDPQTYCLSRGDIALLPKGSGHTLSDHPKSKAKHMSEWAEDSPGGRSDLLEIPGEGPRTSIVCGLFEFEESSAHSIVPNLPTTIAVQADERGPDRSITGVLEIIAAEVQDERQGCSVVLKSLAEVLMVHALRAHIESAGESPAWLYALRDEKVAKVLAMIHEDPASKFNVADLAARVGLSRSELFARFSKLVGEPPNKYSTRWRMHLATQALIREQANLAEVATRVGYATEAAFSKAFKRFMGESPGAYRKRRPAF